MPAEKMLLAFEYERENVLEITCDTHGRDYLIESLKMLGPGDHDHLMAESCGGNELSGPFRGAPLVPIHKVTISLTGDE